MIDNSIIELTIVWVNLFMVFAEQVVTAEVSIDYGAG